MTYTVQWSVGVYLAAGLVTLGVARSMFVLFDRGSVVRWCVNSMFIVALWPMFWPIIWETGE